MLRLPPHSESNRPWTIARDNGRKGKVDQEQIKRICLELMAPMVREFTKTVIEMRRQGASEADIAAMLQKVELGNRGKVEDAILETMMDELRRVCARTRI